MRSPLLLAKQLQPGYSCFENCARYPQQAWEFLVPLQCAVNQLQYCILIDAERCGQAEIPRDMWAENGGVQKKNANSQHHKCHDEKHPHAEDTYTFAAEFCRVKSVRRDVSFAHRLSKRAWRIVIIKGAIRNPNDKFLLEVSPFTDCRLETGRSTEICPVTMFAGLPVSTPACTGIGQAESLIE
jgi:hypothetical protein